MLEPCRQFRHLRLSKNIRAIQGDAHSANKAAADASNSASAGNTVSQAANDSATAAKAKLEKHASHTDNPHNVTAAQIGAATTARLSAKFNADERGLQVTRNQICKALQSIL